jgi:hypothetical protein
MKSQAILVVLSLAAAWAQLPKPPAATSPAAATPKPPAATSPAAVIPTEKPRVSRQTLSELERDFDTKLATTGGASDPIDLMGATRGIYLDGYGVVFTTEVSLIITPNVNPFHLQMTDAEKEKVHQRKVARLPMLRQLMREVWRDSAAALISIPENQQVVISVRLLYLRWEDTRDLPGEIVMKGARRAALTGAIQVEEQ